MELLRIFERKCLRASIDSHRKKGEYLISNKNIYIQSKVERIDSFLIKQAIKFYDRLKDFPTELIFSTGSTPDQNYYIDNIKTKYKPPSYLLRLQDTKKLYDDNNNLIYYHKRRSTDNKNLIYNTNQ